MTRKNYIGELLREFNLTHSTKILISLMLTLLLACSSANESELSAAKDYTAFTGVREVSVGPNGTYIVRWDPMLLVNDSEFLVYQFNEGELPDFNKAPTYKTNESFYISEDLRLLDSQCYIVRLLVEGVLFEKNVFQKCTEHSAFYFTGLSTIETLANGAYFLGWDPTPYQPEGIKFNVYRKYENEIVAGVWEVVETTQDSFYRTEVIPIDQKICFKVKYNLNLILTDENENIICNVDEAIVDFKGIDKSTVTGPGQITINWKKSNRKEVVGYRIYSGNRHEVLLGETDASKTSFVVDNLSLGIDYFFSVRAFNAEGVEDGNTEILKFQVANIIPGISRLELVKKFNESDILIGFECLFDYDDGDQSQVLQPTVKFINESTKSNNEVVQTIRQERDILSGSTLSTYQLVPQLDGRGDKITCSIRVFDGIDYSEWEVSNAIYLEDKSAVSQSLVIERYFDGAVSAHSGDLIKEDRMRSDLTNIDGRVVPITVGRIPQPNLEEEIPNWDGVSVPQSFIDEYLSRVENQLGYFEIDTSDEATMIQVKLPLNGSFYEPEVCEVVGDNQICNYLCPGDSCEIPFVVRPNFFSNSTDAQKSIFGELIPDAGFDYRIRSFFTLNENTGLPTYESWSNWSHITIKVEPVQDFPIATSLSETAEEDTALRLTLKPATFVQVNHESGGTSKYFNVGNYGQTGYYDPDPGDIATSVKVLTPLQDRNGIFVANEDATTTAGVDQEFPFVCNPNGECVTYFLSNTDYNSEESNAGQPIEIEYAVETLSSVTQSNSWSNDLTVENQDNPSPIGTLTINVAKDNDKPVATDRVEVGDEDEEVVLTFSLGGEYTDAEGDPAIAIEVRDVFNGTVGLTSGIFTDNPQIFSTACDLAGTCTIAFIGRENLNSTNTMPGESNQFSFLYRIITDEGTSNFASVNLTINSIDDEPVAQDKKTNGSPNSVFNKIYLLEDESFTLNLITLTLQNGYTDVDLDTNPTELANLHASSIRITNLEYDNFSGVAYLAHPKADANWESGIQVGSIMPCGAATGRPDGECQFGLTLPLDFNGNGVLTYEVYGATPGVGISKQVFFEVLATNDKPQAFNISFDNLVEDYNPLTYTDTLPDTQLTGIRQSLSKIFNNSLGDQYEYGFYDPDSFDKNRASPFEEGVEIEIIQNFTMPGAVLHEFNCMPTAALGDENDLIECSASATLPQHFNKNRGTLTATYRVRTKKDDNNPDLAGAPADVNWSNVATITLQVQPVNDKPVSQITPTTVGNEDTPILITVAQTSGYYDEDFNDLVPGSGVGNQILPLDWFVHTACGDMKYRENSITNINCILTGINAGQCSFLFLPPDDCSGDFTLVASLQTVQTGLDLENVGNQISLSDPILFPLSITPDKDPPHVFDLTAVINEDTYMTLSISASSVRDENDLLIPINGQYFDSDGDKAYKVFFQKADLGNIWIYDTPPAVSTSNPKGPWERDLGVTPVCTSTMPDQCELPCNAATGLCQYYIMPQFNAFGINEISYSIKTKSATQDDTEGLWSDQTKNNNTTNPHDTSSYFGSGIATARIEIMGVPDVPVAKQLTNRSLNQWFLVKEDTPYKIEFSRNGVSPAFEDPDISDSLNYVEIRTPLPSSIGYFRKTIDPTSDLIPINSSGYYILQDDDICDDFLSQCTMWFHPNTDFNYALNSTSDAGTFFFHVETGSGAEASRSVTPGYFDLRVIPVNDPPIITLNSITTEVATVTTNLFLKDLIGDATPELVFSNDSNIEEDSAPIEISLTVDEGGGIIEDWQNITTANIVVEVLDSTYPNSDPGIPLFEVTSINFNDDSNSQNSAEQGPLTIILTPNQNLYGSAKIRISITDDNGIRPDPAEFPNFYSDIRDGSINTAYNTEGDLDPKTTTLEFNVSIDEINDSPTVTIPSADNNAVLNDFDLPAIPTDITLDESTASNSINIKINEDTPLVLLNVQIDEGGGSQEDVQLLAIVPSRISETVTGTGNTDLVKTGTFGTGTSGFSSSKIADNLSDYFAITSTGHDITIVPTEHMSGTTALALAFNDGAGESNSIRTLYINLTVVEVNDLPTISGLVDAQIITINENALPQIATVQIDEGGNSAEDSQKVTLEIVNSTPRAGAVGSITSLAVAGFSADNATKVSLEDAADSGAIERALSLTLQANTIGTFDIDFKLSDDQGGELTFSIVLTIAPIDDAPTISVADTTIAGDEDTTFTSGSMITIDEGGGVDEDSQDLVAVFTSSNNSVIDPSNITLVDHLGASFSDGGTNAGTIQAYIKITPESNKNRDYPADTGDVTITLRIQQAGDASKFVTKDFTVSIAPIPDSPLGTVNCNSGVNTLDVAANTTITEVFSCNGITDNDGQTIVYEITSQNCPAGKVTVSDDYKFNISGLADSCSITIQGGDGTSLAASTQEINIVISKITSIVFSNPTLTTASCNLQAQIDIIAQNAASFTGVCNVTDQDGDVAICTPVDTDTFTWSHLLSDTYLNMASMSVFSRFTTNHGFTDTASQTLNLTKTPIISFKTPVVEADIGKGLANSGQAQIDLSAGDCSICSGERAFISTGKRHACAIDANSDLFCWGAQEGTALGADYDNARTKSVKSSFISSGDDFTCNVNDAGEVICFGDTAASWDTSFYLGTNNSNTAIAISTGYEHACAMAKDYSVRCWGTGTKGQLGDGSIISSNTPKLLDTLAIGAALPFKSIFAGGKNSCAIGTDAFVYCWGSNDYNQIDANGNTTHSTPSQTTFINMIHIAIGETASDTSICGVNSTGDLICKNEAIPDALNTKSSSDKIVLVSSYGDDICSLHESGDLTCFGTNYTGLETKGTNVHTVSMGDQFACTVDSTGTGNCWGSDTDGRLGDSTNDDLILRNSTSTILDLRQNKCDQVEVAIP